MKNCPYCAEEIPEDAITCPRCGSDLSAAPPTPSPPPVQSRFTHERVYFSKGSISVSDTRAVFGDKTYAIPNITSVSMEENKPGPTCLGWILIAGGVMFALTVFIFNYFGLIGLLFAGAGWLLREAKCYSVCINSSSSESKAYESDDEETVRQIVAAVNQAIADNRQHQSL